MATRLESKAAARLTGVARLAKAMSQTTDVNALNWLAAALSAIGGAAAAPEDAAAVLAQAMSKTTDVGPVTLPGPGQPGLTALASLGQGLSGVAARLEAGDAAATAAVLAQAMSKTTDANALASLAQGLSAVAARLEAGDAAATAAVLAQAMSKTTDAAVLNQLAGGLSAVAARLEPKEAARVAPRPPPSSPRP